MALQRYLGLLSERWTRVASAYPADNGFSGTAVYNVITKSRGQFGVLLESDQAIAK